MEVRCDRRVLSGFTRRALRAYPKEYMEACWGRITAGAVLVCAFREVEHQATRCTIDYDGEELANDEVKGLQYLGSLHSHPDCDSAEPSETDWRDALEQDELIMGICAIWKRKGRRRTRTVFWPTTRPLDVKVTN